MKKLIIIISMLFSVAYGQTCDTVTTNAVSNITTTTARVTATGAFGVITYNIRYVRQGYTDTVGSADGSTLKYLTGLQAGTKYIYYYSTFCGTSTSRQYGRYTFTTLSAQVQYTPMASAGYQFKYAKVDSGFHVPFVDTVLNRAALRPGAIVIRSADSLFYGWNGQRWSALATDSFGIMTRLNHKVDSVIVSPNGDSLFYWIDGVSYGQISNISAWRLSGNNSIDSATQFIGTNDAAPLTIKTNGVVRGIVNSVGNVGIGTTAPAAKLHVYKDALNFTKLGTGGEDSIYSDNGIIINSGTTNITLEANDNILLNPSGFGRIGVGVTTPLSSSALDITSTNRGLLIPRLTTTQRNAILYPATGLLIWNTTDSTLNQYRGLSGWSAIGSTYSAGNGLALASTTFSADTAIVSTKAFRVKGTDSLGAITALKSTTLSNGWGLIGGGDLSANRTFAADTVNISSKANVAKSRDSVVSLLSSYLPKSGGTMTGNLTIQKNGLKPLSIGSSASGSYVEKMYVDSAGSGYFKGLLNVVPNGATNGYAQIYKYPFNDAAYIEVYNSNTAKSGYIGSQYGLELSSTVAANNWLVGQWGVGTSGVPSNASSQFEIVSTTKGFLPPRMTQTQRDAIGTPATGLQIYNTTNNTNNTYDGVSWKQQATWGYIAKTANYTALSTDYTIDATSGTFTITLPTAASITGRIYIIKNTGTGSITVATTSSQTIDGSTTYTLGTQYKYVQVQSNGANWIVIANN